MNNSKPKYYVTDKYILKFYDDMLVNYIRTDYVFPSERLWIGKDSLFDVAARYKEAGTNLLPISEKTYKKYKILIS